MSWFNYSQSVLQKVGFDKSLFRKELRKLLRYLSASERMQLLQWCRQQKPWLQPSLIFLPGQSH